MWHLEFLVPLIVLVYALGKWDYAEHLGKYLTTECQFKVVQATTTTITDRYQPCHTEPS